MDRIIQILQKDYDRVEYAMKLGKSIGKENAPEYKELEKELKETGEAIKILRTNADTGDSGLHLQRVSGCLSQDELIDMLDDKRVVNATLTENAWYLVRKQAAEYLLDICHIKRK